MTDLRTMQCTCQNEIICSHLLCHVIWVRGNLLFFIIFFLELKYNIVNLQHGKKEEINFKNNKIFINNTPFEPTVSTTCSTYLLSNFNLPVDEGLINYFKYFLLH